MSFNNIYNFFINIFAQIYNLGKTPEYANSYNQCESTEIEYNKLIDCDTPNKYKFVIIQD